MNYRRCNDRGSLIVYGCSDFYYCVCVCVSQILAQKINLLPMTVSRIILKVLKRKTFDHFYVSIKILVKIHNWRVNHFLSFLFEQNIKERHGSFSSFSWQWIACSLLSARCYSWTLNKFRMYSLVQAACWQQDAGVQCV